MECTETIENALISREQESRLYKFLRETCDLDFLRYELIAKKVGKTADGTAIDWEQEIALDWLNCMLSYERDLEVAKQAATESRHEPFADIRRGIAPIPNYQAFLDTLEQDALDAITSNVPFMEWISQVRSSKPADILFNEAYVRRYADMNLSKRFKFAQAR